MIKKTNPNKILKRNNNFKDINSRPYNIKLTTGTYTLKLGITEPSKLVKTDKKKIQVIVDGEIKNIRINWQKFCKRKSEYIINFTILQNPILVSVVIYGLVTAGVFGTGAWFFSEVNKTAGYLTLAIVILGIIFLPKILPKLGFKK